MPEFVDEESDETSSSCSKAVREHSPAPLRGPLSDGTRVIHDHSDYVTAIDTVAEFIPCNKIESLTSRRYELA